MKRVSFKLAKECVKWLLLPQISGSSGTNCAAEDFQESSSSQGRMLPGLLYLNISKFE